MMNLRYYREVDKLQDNLDFRVDFQTDLLIDLMVQCHDEENDNKMVLMNRLETEMRYMNRKSPYVAMKWLIFIHKVIRKMPQEQIIEGLNCLLDQMTMPFNSQKIDKYLFVKLVNPYKMYLKKLAWRQHLKQIRQVKNQGIINYQVYSKYNFINYTIMEFSAPIREFTSFFNQEYPYLNSYIQLISQDLFPLYRAVLEAFQENAIEKVTFIQIEKMGNQIRMLSKGKKTNKQLQATADNSNSLGRNRSQPTMQGQITPFPNLQSSNLSLICNKN